MANIDENYNGKTKLKDFWPKVKANFKAINDQLINHISGAADKHSADKITYSGSVPGVSDVKAAVDKNRADLNAHTAANATPTTLGHVKVPTANGLSVSGDGSVNMARATTSVVGATQLSNSIADASTDKAATASAIKAVNDIKVDKVAGMGLSTNDYTDSEKTKLAGIESGAQKNTVISVAGKIGAVTLNKSDVGLSNADNTADAVKNVLSAAKWTTPRRLDLTGAINGWLFYGGMDGSSDVEVLTEFPIISSEAADGSPFDGIRRVNNFTAGDMTGNGYIISTTDEDSGGAAGYIYGTQHLFFASSGEEGAKNTGAVLSRTCQYFSESGFEGWGPWGNPLNNKVDKVDGKGLSTNDYTTAEKTKLAGIEAGANNYTHPATHPASMITGLPTALPNPYPLTFTGAVTATYNGSGAVNVNIPEGGGGGGGESPYTVVNCTGTDDRASIQAAIDAAPNNIRTTIYIKGICWLPSYGGTTSNFAHILKVEGSGKNIVLDFGGCASVAVDFYDTAAGQAVLFYSQASAKLEVKNLNAIGVIRSTPGGLYAYMFKNAASTLRITNCQYSASDSSHESPSYPGLSAAGSSDWGTTYITGSQLSVSAYMVTNLEANGSQNMIIENSRISFSGGDGGGSISLSGSASLRMRDSVVTSSDQYWAGCILSYSTGVVNLDSCRFSASAESVTGISLKRGEVKNCSIEVSGGGTAISVGTSAGDGVALCNNILYNNGSIGDSGSGTVKVNNTITAKSGLIMYT